MAYFAQVGAHPSSSSSDGSSGGAAFDPLASHKYSQPPARQDAQPHAWTAEQVETPFPSFGYSQSPSPTLAQERSYPTDASPRLAGGGVGRAPSYGQSDQELYQQAAPAAEAAYSDDYGDPLAADDSGLYGPPPRGDLSKAATLLGAVASLALIMGISVWGYKLIMRDVTGVPVVSAVSGPLRVQPDDPGGQMADHQGLAVNAVAAHGTAEAPADTLRLAPDAIRLTEDDQPVVALTEAAALDGAETLEPSASMPEAQNIEASDPASVIEQRSHDIDALMAELTENAVPLEELQETSVAAAKAAQVTAAVASSPLIETVPSSVLNAPGVRISPRPKVRPARFAPAPVAADVAAAKAIDIDPASLAIGTRLAQLGAYESAEVARSEWVRISGRFGEFFDNKQRVIQRAESGGRIFYRLRAHGFSDLSDARRFCSALVAGNADCIPVSMR